MRLRNYISRILVTIFGMALAFLVHSQENSTDPVVQQYLGAIEKYKSEAELMSSHEIYQEIAKSKELVRLKNNNKSMLPDVTDPGVQKSTAFLTVLEERSKNKEPDASFYFGLHQLQICMVLNEQNGLDFTAESVCDDAMENIEVASSANDPRAMRAIGIMYKKGLGVKKSTYVAADWFIKAAKQYDKENSRENALSALEEAIDLVPDHPGALELRKFILDE